MTEVAGFNGADSHESREFPMTDLNFKKISEFAYTHTGIQLGEHKKHLVYSRIARRIRALNMGSFDQYCSMLGSDDYVHELNDFINAITTNLTSFFRESHHFEFIKKDYIPQLRQTHQANKRIRIWSAGSSTGEEAYSIAMTLKESSISSSWDLKILASDLDSNVLAHGHKGVYDAERIESLPEKQCKRWFLRDASSKKVRVKEELREMVQFNRLNLLNDWPMKGKFDLIFCRNVVIYFDKPTQKVLFDRFAEQLIPGGYLIIGHSESLHKVSDRFENLGQTIYRKIK